MLNTSKICDAADWFDPEVKEIIKNELMEPARFHRKQWEFAMIFLTLQKLGLLDQNKIGLSVGGGNERVLYSIARHIKKLIVTDLYDDRTSWDCARTSDPNEFIRSSKPFPIDNEKIHALRMDMRNLEFEDNSFDFCYSSCAIEHIGDDKDFLQHFNEVNRVLKTDGIYILTTELNFGGPTICDQNNYVFSREHLAKLIADSDLDFVFDVNAGLNEIEVNYPLPSNISNTTYQGQNFLNEQLLKSFPHLVLLRGSVPFTSVLVVLKKSEKEKNKKNINFIDYEKTSQFLLSGANNFKRKLENYKISFSPFSSLPDGVSRFFQDHAHFFSENNSNGFDNKSVFHTDYFWLGNGKRQVVINLKSARLLQNNNNIIQIRIHCSPTYNPNNLKCIYEKDITVTDNSNIIEEINFVADENSNYAFLCKLISGNVSFESISIKSYILKEEVDNPASELELKETSVS